MRGDSECGAPSLVGRAVLCPPSECQQPIARSGAFHGAHGVTRPTRFFVFFVDVAAAGLERTPGLPHRIRVATRKALNMPNRHGPMFSAKSTSPFT